MGKLTTLLMCVASLLLAACAAPKDVIVLPVVEPAPGIYRPYWHTQPGEKDEKILEVALPSMG